MKGNPPVLPIWLRCGAVAIAIFSHALAATADILAQYSTASVTTGDDTLAAYSTKPGVSASLMSGAGGLRPYALQGADAGLSGAFFGSYIDFSGDPSEWPDFTRGTQALELTLQAAPGMYLRIDSIELFFAASGVSMTLDIRSSADQFANSVSGEISIPNYDVSNQIGHVTTTLNSPAIATGPITFRWYGWSGSDFDGSIPYGGFFDVSGPALRVNGALLALPKVTSIQRSSPNGQVQLQGKGAPSATYNVQETASLTSAFPTVTTASGDASGTFQYTETPPSGTTRRFYRFQQQ